MFSYNFNDFLIALITVRAYFTENLFWRYIMRAAARLAAIVALTAPAVMSGPKARAQDAASTMMWAMVDVSQEQQEADCKSGKINKSVCNKPDNNDDFSRTEALAIASTPLIVFGGMMWGFGALDRMLGRREEKQKRKLLEHN
jgi:hypothetical protein